MQNEGRVYFGLFGDEFEPDLLKIGIKPTQTKRKGNPTPKHSSWIYSTEKVTNEIIDIYKMAASIVNDLEPYADNILDASKTYDLNAVLEVVLTITPDDSKSTPAVGFDAQVISFLNKVGATIDIDIYRGES